MKRRILALSATAALAIAALAPTAQAAITKPKMEAPSCTLIANVVADTVCEPDHVGAPTR